MTDILLVEDNIELAGLIREFLLRDGYSVRIVHTGEEAVQHIEAHELRLVLLDIMLPGMDGFAVCSAIRKNSNIPIIIMSAKSEKEDKMSGYLLGADDYVEKPVDIDILSARISALMRRNYELKQKNRILCSGAVSIDKDRGEVFFGENRIFLTGKEYELLLLFVENPGKTLSKEYLFGKIWGVDSFSENQTLTVHIKMLRDKIEEEPRNPKRIQTVWGVGYKYEEI